MTVAFENPADTATEDCLSEDVCFTRAESDGPIINTGEGSAQWGCGTCAAATVFGTFNDLRASCFAGDVGAATASATPAT